LRSKTNVSKGRIGIYFHWPFCLSKCPYCDFNTHIREQIDEAAWRDAYLKSIRHYAGLMKRAEVASVFFGGGTPSLMDPALVGAMIDEVRAQFTCVPEMEISLEANPTSVEAGKFEAFAKAGVNRVSLGVQALNDKDLKFLGREHSAAEALQAIEIAQKYFERMSFDLIYARPGQTLKGWEKELRRAAGLSSGHLSLYQLTIERNTPFYYAAEQGRFSVPKEDLAADFYTVTQDVLAEEGLPAYEVSNHAAPGQECAHNMIYWHYEDYIGIGPGAHGRITLDGVKHATRDHPAPEIWLEYVGKRNHGAHPFQAIGPYERALEALMMGLRLREGLALAKLEQAFGAGWRGFLDEEKLQTARGEGWLEMSDDHIRLTLEGTLRLNALVPFIVKESANAAGPAALAQGGAA
jgi:oxygen-independent coproporphyrinogen-3 oxidase